ncbi:MAG: 2-succinyl-5-enolpyruvyl-6-hydroxy-3-cyclohexene-1-carboxylic-acid synthase [Acidimicrobiia bacterium]
MASDVNSMFCRTLVDEWVRAGLRHAVAAPGSRSSPLALALADDERVRLHVVLDERSAAFVALGAARASGAPVAVLSTSGTAAHFHPAVLEARHGRVPLLVCTADRPAELQATGAPQTADQVNLYGDAPRHFVHLAPDPHPAAVAAWRPTAARAWWEAAGPPAGPVHLNLAFRDPLVPAGEATEVPGRPDGRPWIAQIPARRRMPTEAEIEFLTGAAARAERGAVLAGWGSGDPEVVCRLAATLGWPLLADPLSGARRGPAAVSTYEALLRSESFAAAHRPDLAVRVGAPLTSKLAGAWVDGAPQVLVDPDDAWLDPARAACDRLVADPSALLAAVLGRLEAASPGGPRQETDWAHSWRAAEAAARAALDDHLDRSEDLFEGRVARDLYATLPAGATLVVGSSMPVRDVESFARPRDGLAVMASRGLNGIDGFTSTVTGVAAAGPGPTVGLCGDLTFLHDLGGVSAAERLGVSAVVVVVDNDGGGIFSFLPQADVLDSDRFEALFGTPHGLDLGAVARALGAAGAQRLDKAGDLVPALGGALAAGGLQVLVAPTGDRSANVVRHRQAWEAVATALENSP